MHSSEAKDNTCDWVIESLYQRKNLYVSRVDSSQAPEQCNAIIEKEKNDPFPIPAGCKSITFGQLTSDFKDKFKSYDNSDEKIVKVSNNEKASKFIAKVRNNIHLMLKSKCDAKAKP